jgi:hypothetical protein
MRRTTRWAVGSAAAALPILASASPVAAASAVDQKSASVSFESQGGPTVLCQLTARHDVDSSSGELAAGFATSGGACRGTITVEVRYVDGHGDVASAEGSSREAVRSAVFLHDAGSTNVTVDYSVTFDGCAGDCTHELQTRTK